MKWGKIDSNGIIITHKLLVSIASPNFSIDACSVVFQVFGLLLELMYRAKGT